MKKTDKVSISMGTQIFMGYVCLLVITVAVSSGLYLRTTRQITEQSENVYMSRELLTYQSEFESYVERVDECSRIICNSGDVQRVLTEAADFRSENPDMHLDDAMLRLLTGNTVISSIYIFDTRGNMYEASDNYKRSPAIKDIWSAPWYGEVFDRSKSGSYILRINSGGFFEEEQQEGYISLIRSIMELDSNKLIGTLIVNVSLGPLRERYEKIADEMDMDVVICNEFNNIAFRTGQDVGVPFRSFLKDYIIQGTNYQKYKGNDGGYYKMCCRAFAGTNWRIVGIMEKNSYVSEAGKFGRIALTMLFMDGLIIFIGVWAYKTILSKTLNPILSSMRKASKGDFEVVEPVNSNRELYELQLGYNRMIDRIKDLFMRIEEEQRLKRKYELDVLNAQIKPHFLYNTFDSIGALALTGRNREAYQMIQALGKYYRTSLHKGDEVIVLSDEIKIVKNYLIIQKYRYEDVFDVVYELDESIQSCKVLKLILQPFAENAIYHGLKVMDEGGTITIRTENQGDYILLQVEDDGAGMPEEKAAQILTEGRSQEKASFGVWGTAERIRLYYKQEGLVTIDSREGKGTRVSIRIPKTGISSQG